ncbi:MAG: MFS transporter [Anaerolineales bacterium]
MEKAKKRALLGVSIGHAAHDVWFGLTPVLLAALSGQMALSNADIGLAVLLYEGISSFTQPLFGRLAERVGGRILGVGAILWTTSVFSISLFVESKTALGLCIALGGLGSGAWHPQGMANASIAGGKGWGATSTSIFSLGGMLGSAFLGAALGGYILEAHGRRALLVISVITVALALGFVRRMIPEQIEVPDEDVSDAKEGDGSGHHLFWVMVGFLLLGMALRSLTQFSLNAYIPKYFQDMGRSPATYGIIASLFSAATAIGGVAGSYLGDRIGLQRVLMASLLLGCASLLLFVRLEAFWSALFLILCGLAVGPSQTLFIVTGQRRFPRRMAMISGVFLGFTFISGSGGSWLLGLLADRIGLGSAFSLLPWALLISAFFTLLSVPRFLHKVLPEREDAPTA